MPHLRLLVSNDSAQGALHKVKGPLPAVLFQVAGAGVAVVLAVRSPPGLLILALAVDVGAALDSLLPHLRRAHQLQA